MNTGVTCRLNDLDFTTDEEFSPVAMEHGLAAHTGANMGDMPGARSGCLFVSWQVADQTETAAISEI
jgi:hypothetical protein